MHAHIKLESKLCASINNEETNILIFYAHKENQIPVHQKMKWLVNSMMTQRNNMREASLLTPIS